MLIFNKPESYKIEVIATNSCESFSSTLQVKVNPKYDYLEDISICQGEHYKSWTESGTYESTFQSISGCDSIITTTLIVNSSYNTSEQITLCESESYNGWTESGIYERTLSSITGCDSIVTTYLTINPTFNITEEVNICDGENYLNWDNTGTYERNIPTLQGCDSIINTYLTVNPAFFSTNYISICSPESYNGWTESGEYTENYTSVTGCDSTITTYLTVNPRFNETEEITICEGEEYNGWNENGNYQRTLSSISGCDSIINTNLWVDKFEETPFITQNVDTLISNFSSGNQWYLNDEIIESETSQNCILNTSGTYHVIVTNSNGCKETSELFLANKTSIEELNNLAFKIYPNPSKGIITVEFSEEFNGQINVLNTLGQKIYSQQCKQSKTEINISAVKLGIYFIEVTNDEFSKIEKIIIK